MTAKAKTAAIIPVAERESSLKAQHYNTNYTTTPAQFEKTIEDLPSEQQDILRWWFFHGKENNLSLSKLAERCTVSSGTLSRIFRGTYGAELNSVCQRLTVARETYAGSVANPDFIMTSLARRMWSIFHEARDLACVHILWGKMGSGKTTAAENYKEQHNHGRTAYYRCGAATSFTVFLAELAASMGITAKNRGHQDVRLEIKRLMAVGQRLLIVDELHEIFETCHPNTAVKIAEFFREIHDCAKCGLVLIGTPVLRKHLKEGPLKDILAQLVNRSPDGLITLPAKHTKQDVIAIHEHYGLKAPGDDQPEARRLLGELNKTDSLRKLALTIRAGARTAQIAQEPFTWDHVVKAHAKHAALIHLSEEERAAA